MASPAGNVTRQLARFVAAARLGDMPEPVRHQGARAFVNWMGCALGGSGDSEVAIVAHAAASGAGTPVATLLGQRRRADLVSAALVNSFASSVLAFNDFHPATAVHPAGPPAAALFAIAERDGLAGAALLEALIVGMELECRLAIMLMVPPARCRQGFSPTGLVGGIGAAAAAGKLLGLDERHLVWAIGLAAVQAGGFRETIGSMAGNFISARTAKSGLEAALLAAQGFTCSEHSIEGEKGFAACYGEPANLAAAVAGLGAEWRVIEIDFKPYPCGVWVNATVALALELARQPGFDWRAVEALELRVHPPALQIAGRAAPRARIEAQASLYHWAAAVLKHGQAGPAQGSDECARDPDIVALRGRIRIAPDPALGLADADGAARLAGGQRIEARVRGSGAPLGDAALERKFLTQAAPALAPGAAPALLDECWRIAECGDVGALARRFFAAA